MIKKKDFSTADEVIVYMLEDIHLNIYLPGMRDCMILTYLVNQTINCLHSCNGRLFHSIIFSPITSVTYNVIKLQPTY